MMIHKRWRATGSPTTIGGSGRASRRTSTRCVSFGIAAAILAAGLTHSNGFAAQEGPAPASEEELQVLRHETEALREELEVLRKLLRRFSEQLPPVRQPEEDLLALEQQIRDLQTEVDALKSRLPGEAPAGPQERPAQEAPPPPGPASPSGATEGTGQLPAQGVTSPRTLNPAVGAIGNFVGAGGSSQGGSEAVAPSPSFTLQESEVSFQAAVDPFARADFFMAIGEQDIEVEEGYVTFLAVPGGLSVKAGRMRARFGRLNEFHNHTLPWVDRPLVMFNLLGGSTQDPDTGIKDSGVSVSWLAPTETIFVEATGEVFRGDSGTLFQPTRRRDVSVAGHVRTYGDLSSAANLEAGVSYARGHNDLGSDFVTQLYGLDLTFRWKPPQQATYRSLAARSELIWSRREETAGTQGAAGGFVSADYRLNRRWFVGVRYDWSDRARQAAIRDRGASAVLTFWPSEFSQLRAQYRRTDYGDEDVANELLMQVLFTIGAHGAHPF
jgi:hypothetical protein